MSYSSLKIDVRPSKVSYSGVLIDNSGKKYKISKDCDTTSQEVIDSILKIYNIGKFENNKRAPLDCKINAKGNTTNLIKLIILLNIFNGLIDEEFVSERDW